MRSSAHGQNAAAETISGSEPSETVPALVYVKLTLMAVFWGGTFIAGKIAARHMGPFTAAFFRFFIASLFLWLAVLRIEGRVPRPSARQVLPCMLLGLTGVFSYNLCFFKGLALIEASRAAIIIANNPIGIALFSALIFGERLTPVRLLGILVSVSGAMVVISRGDFLHILDSGVGTGELLIIGCVISWVAFSLLGKVFMKAMTPLSAVFFASVTGTLFLLPAAVSEGLVAAAVAVPWKAWLAIFYLGLFGTVLGFVWYYEGIRSIGPTKAGVFINAVPVSAIVFSYVILNEPLTGSLLIGAALVLGGIWLTNRPAVHDH
jgi:drug/metabolite transporter (DMT)-like permease